MSKLFTLASTALLLSAVGAFAGDAAAGEKDYKKCKACHMIASADEVIVKGGKTGPNLYGVVGRPVASFEDFRYGDGIKSVGAGGAVWDEALLTEYVMDPNKFISAHGDGGKSKMTFKLKTPEDVVAYLATFSETPDAEAAADEAPTAAEETEAPAEEAAPEEAPAKDAKSE